MDKWGSTWGTLEKTLTDKNVPSEFKNLFGRDKIAFEQWREREMLGMGYEKVNGQWGHPYTVMPGAEMKVYKGVDGDWHARYDKSVTGTTADGRTYETIKENKTLHFQNPTAKAEIKPNANDWQNNYKFFNEVQPAVESGNPESLRSLVADTKIGPIIDKTGGITSIHDVTFDETNGNILLNIQDIRTGDNFQLPVNPEPTTNGWKLTEVDSGLKSNPYTSMESTTNFVVSKEPSNPQFFNPSEVAKENPIAVMDPSHEIKSAGAINIVDGKATIPVQDANTGIGKSIDVKGVKGITPTLDGKSLSVTTSEGQEFDISYGRLAAVDAIAGGVALTAGALFLARERQITKKVAEKFVAPVVKIKEKKLATPVVEIEDEQEKIVEEPKTEVVKLKEEIIAYGAGSYGKIGYGKKEGKGIFSFEKFNIEPKNAREMVYSSKEIPQVVLDSDIEEIKFNEYTKELAGLEIVRKAMVDSGLGNSEAVDDLRKKAQELVEKMKKAIGADPRAFINKDIRDGMELGEIVVPVGIPEKKVDSRVKQAGDSIREKKTTKDKVKKSDKKDKDKKSKNKKKKK